jgi:ketosteroid isomerase-like protein
MPDQPAASTETVRAIYAALADDPAALLALVDGDAPVLGPPAGDGDEPRGAAALQRLLAGYRPYFREFAVEPVEISSGGERVLVRLRLGGVGLSGAQLSHESFHVHTVRAGRCVRIEVFEDAAQAARAAGLDR